MSARLHKILLFTFLALAGVSALLFTSLRAQKVIAAAGVNKVINFQGKVTNSNGTNVADGTYDFVIKLYDAATSTATNTYTESWTAAALWSSTMSSAPTSGQESLTYSTNTNEASIKVGQILWNTTKEEPVVVIAVNTGTNVITISPTRQAWATGDTVTNKIYVKDGTFKVAINALNQDLSGVNFGTDNVFMGINFNADGEMKPRIQYTASPYAMNAEKVNGLTVTNTSDAAFTSATTLKVAEGKTLVFNNGLTFSGTDSTTFTFPSGSGTVVTLDSTAILTNKTIGSTGLTFSGATTDVTTGTNEDLILTPNGTGKIGLGTFSTALQGYFDVRSPLGTTAAASISAQTSMASLVVDNRGLGDIFTASSSGFNRFVITQAGSLGIGTTVPFHKVHIYDDLNSSVNINLANPNTGSSAKTALILSSSSVNNSINLNYINSNNGNTTLLTIPSSGVLYTGASASNGLVLGSSAGPVRITTNGTAFSNEKIRINIDGNVGIGTTNPIGLLNIRGTTSLAQGAALVSLDQLGAADLFTASVSGVTKFSIANNGNIAATGNLTGLTGLTLASGGINLGGGVGSGAQCLLGGATAAWGSCGSGTSQWTTTVNDIYYTTGNIGVGTTTPIGLLNINGNAKGKALAILNETGNQDLITASASGVTKFTVARDGTVILGGNDFGAPSATTIRGSAASGTNIPGADLTLSASSGTGVGGSGNLIFKTASSNGSGVTFDAAASSQTNPDAATLAWTHTTGSGSNRMLIVGVSLRNNYSVSSITYGAQSLTKVRNDNPGSDIRTEIWYLIAPNSGSNTVTVTVPSPASITAGSVSFTGVGQTIGAGIGSNNGATSSTGSPSVNVTSATGEVVVDIAGTQSGGGTLTVGASQTQAWNQQATSVNGAASYESGAGTTTMSWTSGDTGQPWAISAVAIKPAGDGTAANTLVERLRITPDGNVGIGTTAPSGILDVSNGRFVVSSTGNIGVGTSAPAGVLDVSGGALVVSSAGNVGIGTSAPQAKLHVNSLSGTAPIASISGRTSFAGLVIDNSGSGDLLTASVSGVSRFTVGNQGGITINSGSTDIHKSTSGNNTKDTDFTRTANSTSSTLTNVTASNNQISLDTGAVSNAGTGTITTAGQPALPAALGAGALAILRPDGKYLIVRGAAVTTMYLYDSLAGSISTFHQVLGAGAGAGSIALPRSDGKYRVVHGNSVTTTSLVDPMGVTAVGASIAIGTAPSVKSTVAYRRQNGRYFVAIGGTTATSVYNPSPTTETFSAGPTANTTGLGALLLPRPDGSALLVNGGATATTQLYNPNNGTITNGAAIGSLSSGPSLPTNCEINGAGSVAIQLPNWRYLILSKANVSVEYDAVTNTMGTCRNVGPATALGDGAHAVRYQSRKILIMVGGNSTASYIYDPADLTYTAHGTAMTAVGLGAFTVMNHDGTFQAFVGNATTSNKIDTGLKMGGSYISEDFNTTSININSSIMWSIGAENTFIGTSSATTDTPQSNVEFFVRTASTQGGLSSAIDKPIQRSGDLIGAVGTDAWARVTINMRRPIPQNILDERFTYFGNGTTLLLKDFAGPTVFDYTIDNSTVLRRTAFNFVNAQLGTDAMEASASSLLRVVPLADRLTLPLGQVPGDAQISTTGYYQGLIGSHPTVPVSTGEGTVVMSLPDGQFGVIATASAAVSYYHYDPASSVFIPQSGAGNIPTTYPGAGAYALKLPDGRFLIVFGADIGGTARTTTNIYDPRAASGSRFIAGPALSAAAGIGGFPIKNTDGSYTLVHGGAATTSTSFNPFTDLKGKPTLDAGPTLTSAVTCGGWAIPTAGNLLGMYRVFTGVAQFGTGVQTTMMYDATKKQFSASANSGVAFGCGSYVFQRQDGAWIVVAGGSGTTGAPSTTLTLFNPFSNVFGAAAGLTNAVGRGSVAIPRPDGTWLITRGQGQTIDGTTAANGTTNIYSPFGGTQILGYPIGTNITTGPTIANTNGAGALAFQRPDGKWVMLSGGMAGSNNAMLIDVGYYADGQSLSGQMYSPQLSPDSSLSYKSLPDNFLNFEVRTAPTREALMTADYKSVYPADGNIGAATGDKWIQVQINFSRQFPTYGDVMQDVWMGRGALNWRNISQPTLFEYKITNDANLLTLQSGGQNIFRVSGSGNIYSGQQGGFFSGGADLAENYSSVQELLPGEVVIADAFNPQKVVRSTGQYQSGLIGVVSTEPGFVAGAFTQDSYPIALVGRVPVKISTENGSIKTGDYLTSASIPGYAMRALQSGRVIGKALEDLDESALTECPTPGAGANPQAKCGTVMMFVNLTDYHGESIKVAMAQASPSASISGISTSTDENGVESYTGIRIGDPEYTTVKDEFGILSFLKDLKSKSALAPTSEIFTGRLSAAFDIISPTIITDTLYAKTIKADHIEGLEILTNKIGSLSASLYGLTQKPTEQVVATRSADQATSESTGSALFKKYDDLMDQALARNEGLLRLEDIDAAGSATVGGQLRVKGNSLVEGILNVIDTLFANNIIVNGTAHFLGDLFIKGDTTFEGQTTFNNDTAGFAEIKKGAQQVEVTFAKEYKDAPVINASVILQQKDGSTDEEIEVARQKLFDQNIRFVITKQSSKGFTLILNKVAPDDLNFSWSAVSVKSPNKFSGYIDAKDNQPKSRK